MTKKYHCYRVIAAGQAQTIPLRNTPAPAGPKQYPAKIRG
ncbi:hypothetical protein LHK_02435 [Laribacter hongkongensis HLHK9]|uniref:Uncharacterized protein n=1 Tax=Laribacter hongkongensis (strain HLHK9) TaxID=557598 RepID=C1DB79_LARHH|nr:hypothetical protein LHK_02435 [Laribacter hongkongensis HLHK9]